MLDIFAFFMLIELWLRYSQFVKETLDPGEKLFLHSLSYSISARTGPEFFGVFFSFYFATPKKTLWRPNWVLPHILISLQYGMKKIGTNDSIHPLILGWIYVNSLKFPQYWKRNSEAITYVVWRVNKNGWNANLLTHFMLITPFISTISSTTLPQISPRQAARKVSVFRVILVRIFLHSDWIRRVTEFHTQIK